VIVLSANANAFIDEKDHGLPSMEHDYLAKPVHLQQLLDRLAYHLVLKWQRQLRTAPSIRSEWRLPPRRDLEELYELCGLGYMRGIQHKLDAIERESADSAGFVADLRTLAKGFRLDELSLQLKEALNERPDSTC
jgi:DNA-binding response OmpR family regulator